MKLVYFVIIAILFTSAVNAQSSSITTDRSATGFSVPVRIVDPNGEARAAEERAEAQRRDAVTNKHDTEDLIAQQKAANAAERSASSSDTQVSIGWLQLAVSLIGFIALLATLLLNRRATDAAVKATNAALEANKFAQSQFIVDQRPWLRLERPVISLKEHRNTFAIGLEIEAFNVGKTPAIEAELHFDVKFTQLAPPSVEGVQRFARQIMKPTEWRDAHKIVFPNANRPFDEVIILDDRPPENLNCRVVYCVTYKGSGSDEIFHTAGEATFPTSRLISALNASNSGWKYTFHGTSSVA